MDDSVEAHNRRVIEEFAGKRNYPVLSAELARQLALVPVSNAYYHPSVVTLRDGRVVDRVYVADAKRWIMDWGVWPENDRGKRSLDIMLVASIADSPTRLPAHFADEIYRAGESGMGYTIFTVRFQDGTSVAIGTGNAIDFINYPEGQSPDTIASVLPHVGRADPHILKAPEYTWCLFDRETPAV